MTAVVVLIVTLISLGVYFLLPQSPGLWFHVPLTAWLSFIVLFNYHAAVTADSGVPLLYIRYYNIHCDVY